MKKILMVVVTLLLVCVLLLGGVYFYKISTPEYALAKTLEDIDRAGVRGLKHHLTRNATEKINSLEEKASNSKIANLLPIVSQDKAMKLVLDKMDAFEWSVEDVLKGKKQADIILRFDYEENISGTIEVIMVKENREWKIDELNMPHFDKVLLG